MAYLTTHWRGEGFVHCASELHLGVVSHLSTYYDRGHPASSLSLGYSFLSRNIEPEAFVGGHRFQHDILESLDPRSLNQEQLSGRCQWGSLILKLLNLRSVGTFLRASASAERLPRWRRQRKCFEGREYRWYARAPLAPSMSCSSLKVM